jgi:hypothetical protein
VSGLLALIITGAKMPGIKEQIGNIELIRWFLVVHVNLATLVWFTALPVGLVYLSTFRPEEKVPPIRIAGLLAAIAGVGLIVTAFPGPDVTAILANYVPVVTHPRMYFGIGLYLLGIACAYCSRRTLLPVADDSSPGVPGLLQARFGLWIGTVFAILAVATFAVSVMQMSRSQLFSTTGFFEVVMWGGGHLLQHSSIAFLAVCWIVLHSLSHGRALFSRAELFPVFAVLGVPALLALGLLKLPVTGNEYREGFTQLMRYGMAPPMIFLAGWMYVRGRNYGIPGRPRGFHRAALGFSVLLLILGTGFGIFIRGHDMRIPGHYHATIGAITIAFMAIAYHLLAAGERVVSRWMPKSVWTYGIGQTMFASGMFIAGSFGMGRKTYGAEHFLSNWGQYAGFGMMAAGGLIAFAGGLFFSLAIAPKLFKLKVTTNIQGGSNEKIFNPGFVRDGHAVPAGDGRRL